MSNVQRYDQVTSGVGWGGGVKSIPRGDGLWVKHEDYASLKTEKDRVQLLLDEATSLVRDCAKWVPRDRDWTLDERILTFLGKL